jgi:hypothetical protein
VFAPCLDADRLGRDPAMRWAVGGRAVWNEAASTSRLTSATVMLTTSLAAAVTKRYVSLWTIELRMCAPNSAPHGTVVTGQLDAVAESTCACTL